MRWLAAAALVLLPAAAMRAPPIPDNRIEIGVIAGTGVEGGEAIERAGVVAASMAAEDFGAAAGPVDVEIRGTPPDASGAVLLRTVRQWLSDPHVGLIVDAAGSRLDAALAGMAAAKHRLLARTAPASDPGPDLCRGTSLDWGEAPAVLAQAAARAIAASGRRRVFVIAVEDGWGAAMQADLAGALGPAQIGQAGVTEGAQDLGPAFAQAARANADVVVLAAQGPELQRAWRQAREAGASARFLLVVPGATPAEADLAGEGVAAGTLIVGGWNPEASEDARIFASRFRQRFRERRPLARDAAVFAAVYAYLEAARREHTLESGPILSALRAHARVTILGPVTIRGSGVAARDVPLFRVKPPGERRDPAESLSPRGSVPAAEAYAAICGGR